MNTAYAATMLARTSCVMSDMRRRSRWLALAHEQQRNRWTSIAHAQTRATRGRKARQPHRAMASSWMFRGTVRGLLAQCRAYRAREKLAPNRSFPRTAAASRCSPAAARHSSAALAPHARPPSLPRPPSTSVPPSSCLSCPSLLSCLESLVLVGWLVFVLRASRGGVGLLSV